jgi:hypothetical protein
MSGILPGSSASESSFILPEFATNPRNGWIQEKLHIRLRRKILFQSSGEQVDRALRRAMFLLPGKAGIFLASSDGYLFSAKGAAFIRKPGATPRGFAQHQTVSAESAIHSRANRCRINDEPVR